MIELSGLEEKGVRIEKCSEIKDTISISEYLNYIIPEQKQKIFHKEIDLQIPYRIDTEQGIMIVRIDGKCRKVIKGLYGHLLAIFALVRQFQNGTLYCRYCNRNIPEQCQIVALLNFLSA